MGWVAFLMSCVFEMTGISIGTYTYWGPHVLRVFHYPLGIGVLEAAQTICFAVAASQLRQRATSRWSLLGLSPRKSSRLPSCQLAQMAWSASTIPPPMLPSTHIGSTSGVLRRPRAGRLRPAARQVG